MNGWATDIGGWIMDGVDGHGLVGGQMGGCMSNEQVGG